MTRSTAADCPWCGKNWRGESKPAVRLRRDSDGAERDFYPKEQLDLEEIRAWKGDAKLFITVIYNELGLIDMVGNLGPIDDYSPRAGERGAGLQRKGREAG